MRVQATGEGPAPELQGYAHSPSAGSAATYGPVEPPAWLATLPMPERFLYRRSKLLGLKAAPSVARHPAIIHPRRPRFPICTGQGLTKC